MANTLVHNIYINMYVYVLCLLHVDGRNYVCLLLYIGYYGKLNTVCVCVCD